MVVPSSLVPIRITVPPGRPRCPRKLGWALVSLDSGQVVPAACRANLCGYCGPYNARLIGGAITLATPERFGTLTQVGNDWQTVRARMKRVAYDLRAAVPDWSWCWHVEPNPRRTGHHVHFWQRGGYVPQRLLSAVADRRGCGGVADVRAWKMPSHAGTNYGVKMAGVAYGMKMADASASQVAYLAANGGRLVHASRGWWRDNIGKACGQREGMAAWAAESGDSWGERWVLVREEGSAADARPLANPPTS